ncbi:serine/threonine-protein kinase [Actinomadura parmotrematis]|uniref:Serine/threonine protein kinase n=1 Tax=Actinomadura parmotrematis TaxID=2864039 RepID=A0ABS7FN86_9ACTN|nr:serine/threonine-protein kinase [Actinomadura parmotrematis]MBW8481455.1 serine/threonine protein kinase [Actinomadura parmotrematis]
MPAPVPVYEPLRPDDPRAAGPYRLLALIGAGSGGRAYLAGLGDDRRFAVTFARPELAVRPEFRRLLAQEAAAAGRVRGPRVAAVVAAGADDPAPWIAAEHVPGPSLAYTVAATGPLPVASVRLLVAGVAEALAAFHEAGIVHGDLKPSNVLLAEDGAHVTDASIARAAAAAGVTRADVEPGALRFLAPEHLDGEPPAPPLDVFALGGVALFAATGRPPFGDGTAADLVDRVGHGDPDLEGCPEELRDLVARCLAKDPADRPGLRELLAELAPLNAGASGPWLPEDVMRRLPAYADAAPYQPKIPEHLHGFPKAPMPPPGGLAARSPGPAGWLVGLGAGATALAVLLAVIVALAVAYFVFGIGDGGGEGNGVAAPHEASSAPPPPSSSPPGGTGAPGGAPNAPQPGQQLGHYPRIDLSDGQTLTFSGAPAQPGVRGDFTFAHSFLSADRMALLDPGTAGGYQACTGETRYFTSAWRDDVPPGSLLCVLTAAGRVGLIHVIGYGGPPPTMLLELTVWQGAPATGN